MLRNKLNESVLLAASWDLKVAVVIALLAAGASAVHASYEAGQLACSNSPEYLSCLGVLSRHGDYLAELNKMHLQISISLFLVAVGFWSRKVLGFLLSLLALIWIGKIYLFWHIDTLAFMHEHDIEEFALLQGPERQHLVTLRYATWLDAIVLVVIIMLFVWQVKALFGAMRTPRIRNEP